MEIVSFEDFWKPIEGNSEPSSPSNPTRLNLELDLSLLTRSMEKLENEYNKIVAQNQCRIGITSAEKRQLLKQAKSVCMRAGEITTADKEDPVEAERSQMCLKPEDVEITSICDGEGLRIAWKGTLPKRDNGYRYWYPFANYGIMFGLLYAIDRYFKGHPRVRFSPENPAFVKLTCTYRTAEKARDYDNLDVRETFNAMKEQLLRDDSPLDFVLYQDSRIGRENSVELTIVPFEKRHEFI